MNGTQTHNEKAYYVTLYLNGIESHTNVCNSFEEAQELGQKWIGRAEDNPMDAYDYVIDNQTEQYTGKYNVGDIITFTGKIGGMTHECEVTHVWNVDGRNGVSIIPTGNYGFEIDVYEDLLND